MTDTMNAPAHEHAPPPSQLLTVREVAAELRVSTSLVYELIESRKLACHRIGKRRGAIRVRRADLEAFIERCRIESEAPPVRPPRPKLKHLHLK